MNTTRQVQCIVCPKVYALPELEDLGLGGLGDGRHMWTCSDECQKVFQAKGGLQAFMEKPIAGRIPSSRR